MRYIVRVWVDLEVNASSEDEAKSIANNHPINVEHNEAAGLYDMQISGEVWLYSSEKENRNDN